MRLVVEDCVRFRLLNKDIFADRNRVLSVSKTFTSGRWCVHRQMLCNDGIFVFNANCVDAFQWAARCAARLFKRPF